LKSYNGTDCKDDFFNSKILVEDKMRFSLMSFPSKEEALFVDKEKFDLYCKKESKCKEKELNDRELIESIGGDKYGKEEEYERSEGLEKDVRVRLGGK
jgi:hypothetical protein